MDAIKTHEIDRASKVSYSLLPNVRRELVRHLLPLIACLAWKRQPFPIIRYGSFKYLFMKCSQRLMRPGCLFLISLCLFCFSIFLALYSAHIFSILESEMPIDLECLCVYQNMEYDFCYHLPENHSIRGEKFTCENARFLHSLGLLNRKSQERDADRYVDLEMMELPAVVMVTAFSEDHWPEARRLISTIRRFWPHQKVIVYDLGLEATTVYAVRQLCNVEYRKFEFAAYPPYVHRLGEFRWKPLIIAKTLQEFGAIWYLDSSVVFKKGDLNHVYDLVRCKRMRSRPTISHMIPSVEYRDRRETNSSLENGWNQRLWRSNVRECTKSTYLLHSFTGHGIFAATHPETYRFFPTNFEEIKKQKAKMYEAGLIFAVYTADTVANILRWYVACALEEDCMGSRNPLSYCNFNTDRFAVFANCHRYDQSVVNLLIANAFFYDRHYYTSEIVDFFNIIRGTAAMTTDDVLHCD